MISYEFQFHSILLISDGTQVVHQCPPPAGPYLEQCVSLRSQRAFSPPAMPFLCFSRCARVFPKCASPDVGSNALPLYHSFILSLVAWPATHKHLRHFYCFQGQLPFSIHCIFLSTAFPPFSAKSIICLRLIQITSRMHNQGGFYS